MDERTRDGSPEFYKLLDECAKLHENKSHDYANNDNPFGNYHFAGQLASMFSYNPKDAGFVGRIGEKIFRLANLESTGKVPKNESIEDTERDILVITALWMTSRRNDRRNNLTASRTEEASPRVRNIPEGFLSGSNRQNEHRNIADFARAKAEESAGIFIANRADAIEPFAHRLTQILLEWENWTGK